MINYDILFWVLVICPKSNQELNIHKSRQNWKSDPASLCALQLRKLKFYNILFLPNIAPAHLFHFKFTKGV